MLCLFRDRMMELETKKDNTSSGDLTPTVKSASTCTSNGQFMFVDTSGIKKEEDPEMCFDWPAVQVKVEEGFESEGGLMSEEGGASYMLGNGLVKVKEEEIDVSPRNSTSSAESASFCTSSNQFVDASVLKEEENLETCFKEEEKSSKVVNISFLLYNTDKKSKGEKTITYKKYREILIEELIGNMQHRTALKRSHSSSAETEERLNKQQHWIAGHPTSRSKDCAVCSNRKEKGKRRETVYFCETCTRKPGLHPGECFKRYHTLVEYRKIG